MTTVEEARHDAGTGLDPELPRYLTSYRARRAYAEPIQEPPAVKGVTGAIDIHCHATPSQQDPLSLAKLANLSGMGGLLFKSIGSSNERAAGAVQKLREELAPWAQENDIEPLKMWAGYGIARGPSISTPEQVAKQIADGVVAIWMPIANSATTLNKIGTWTTLWDRESPRRHSDPLPWDFSVKVGQYTLDERGELKTQIKEIFRVIADGGVAVSFAHASHAEIEAMANEVARLNIKRAFIDHPFSPFVDLSLEMMKQYAAAGIYLNFTYDEISPLLGVDPARMAQYIREVGTRYVTLSSDAGEPLFPNSVECIRLIRGYMRAFGLTEEQIEEVSVTNPARLAGLLPA
jgi:hypothetical protein